MYICGVTQISFEPNFNTGDLLRYNFSVHPYVIIESCMQNRTREMQIRD
jgi:hypothetical protein